MEITIIITIIITLFVIWGINCFVIGSFNRDYDNWEIYVFCGIWAIIIKIVSTIYYKIFLIYNSNHYNLYKIYFRSGKGNSEKLFSYKYFMKPKVANEFKNFATSKDGTGIEFIGTGKEKLENIYFFKNHIITQKMINKAKKSGRGILVKLLKNP